MNMPVPKSRLGRGLASLIGEPAMATPRLPAEGQQRVVPVDQLHPSPLNPRKAFNDEALEELAVSIRQKGLVQPLIVRVGAEGGYEIVAGERRWRAAQKAGVHVLPVIVRDLDDRDVMEMALIENVQRADLNPVEEAVGYNELIQRYQYTQEQLADVIGKSRSHLTNTLRLLKLPDDVRAMVLDGRLTAGQVRPLVGRDDAVNWALRIAAGGMSVRQVEEAMQNLDRARDSGGDGATPAKREKDADTKAFEKEFGDALGLKVEIKRGSGESGLLVIKFGNYDQLDYIRGRVLGGGAGS